MHREFDSNAQSESFRAAMTTCFRRLNSILPKKLNNQRTRRTWAYSSIPLFSQPQLFKWGHSTSAREQFGLPNYAVLACGEPPEGYVEKYGDYGEMTIKFLTDKPIDDTPAPMLSPSNYKKYLCYKNEIPTMSELLQYKGVIVTGSKCDAHDTTTPWINELRNLIANTYSHAASGTESRNGSFNVVGLCFGHQLIANAMNDGQTGRATCGWEIGVKNINLNQKFNKIFANIGIDSIKVLQLHRDCVMKMPSNGIRLGSSGNTDVELYTLPKQGFINTLCTQGHPEFTVEYMKFIIDFRGKAGIIPPETCKEAMDIMEYDGPDTAMWQKLIHIWLQKD